MLYTMKDVREKLDNMVSRYVKVEIDGEIKGIAYMDDLRERAFAWGESGRKKIRKVFLSGKTFDVRIGINLYPATSSELWCTVERRLDELNNISERPMSTKKEESANLFNPLVSYDEKTGMVHFPDDKEEKSQKPKKTIKPEKTINKVGLFERIRSWLKGDRELKRHKKNKNPPLKSTTEI